jgi:hyperosmotically inducible periplasmic protein
MNEGGWRWAVAAAIAALMLAGCDRDTKQAVNKAGAEVKREAKEAGAQAKETAKEMGEAAGQAVGDAAITAKVKAALHAEKDVKSRDIDVETFQGKVVLKGAVLDQAQSHLALKVAQSVDGVKSVENRITVN